MSCDTNFLPIILRGANLPWEEVVHLGVPVSFPQKTIISDCSSSATASGLYYIKRGRIKLSHITPNGQEKVLFYLGQGTLFNEIPMLFFTNDYLFTCEEQVDAIFWSKEQITTDFVKKYPHLMLNILESISRKAQNFYSQLCGLQGFDSFVNVCRALCSMEQHNKERDKIVPCLTQLELAAFLGAHRSTLHKALARLKQEHIIAHYCKSELVILDLQRLQLYAIGQ